LHFVRIALVSPYSWSYQGGVNRHVEALAEEFLGRGHHVRVLAPFDPPGRLSRVLHRAAPETREIPDYLIPLGRTAGFPSNGAISNLAPFPAGGVLAPRRELSQGNYDVVHIHEPLVPLVGWNAALGTDAPAVGTFHAYSTKPLPNHIASALGARRMINRLSARIAVSEAAAWTGRRWFGGHYEVIPNGVDVAAAPPDPKPASDELRVLFVGRPEERKGLPVLLRAWPEIRRRSGARLRLIGTDPLQYRLLHTRLHFDEDGIDVLGIVPNEVRTHELERAKLSVTPALGGESFGLVLAEAFACATPAVASNIPGYAAVAIPEAATLVPPSDPTALADAVIDMLGDEERRVEMGRAARAHALANYAWDDVARRLEETYLEVAA